MVIKYFAWLSSSGEKQYIQDGALYVGLVRNAPHFIKHLLNEKETRQYCVISANKMEGKMELSENVKTKLSEVVEVWADENLEGKPALLANAMFFSLESEMLKKQKEIMETFNT